MKTFNLLILSVLLTLAGCSFRFQGKSDDLDITHLYCNGAENPVCDSNGPLFGWTMDAAGFNRKQSAYQILVATSAGNLSNDKADAWNTGKIISDQSQWVKYSGKALIPGNRYFWKVKVWDEHGTTSAYSQPAWFFVPVKDNFWQARWISDSVKVEGKDPGTAEAPLFRKSFSLEDLPAKAVLRYTGAGYIDMFANGKPVSDAVLQPSFTRYDKRMEYITTDITNRLQKGENVLACMPGNGFYNVDTRSAWKFNQAPWRDRPAVICRLVMTWPDGRKQEIVTDDNWKTAPGPVVFNQIRNGETYNARLAQAGWNKPGFDDSNWRKAHTVEGPSGTMSPQIIPPMRRIGYLSAVKITEPAPGVYVFDYGQNLAGWTKLSFSGKRGQEIVIRHGERIDSAGRLDQKELSRFVFTGETQTSRYTSNGDGNDAWEPGFVYYGFRYAEVTGLTQKPDEETLKACIVHTDFEPAGELHTGSDIINQLHENTLWSYLGNFHSIPEDCPHREKMGWTGDGQLAAGAGMLNFYSYNGYRKWMNDFTDEQKENGNLPGVIPTSGWGYDYGRDPEKRP
ncbi:MAG TPA: family 78 glycoside hydrolase catalytic domain, partial [Bacteroidales bacterium]|nr:family 78 glycoside hydrolase catalytic domain [Bacteroidales bacterium]